MSKRKKTNTANIAPAAVTDQTKERQLRKKNIRRIVSLAVIAVLVVVLALLPLMSRKRTFEDGPKASILSETVENKSIETVLVGGGTLTEESAVSVTVPHGVKLLEFLVKNGDTVAAGDAIATIDRVTAVNAMMEVSESLTELAKQIEDAAVQETTGSVISYAPGTVKIIYGEVGDSVQEVMLEHGALAVLSLDGRMAVEIATESLLSAGKKVNVTLSDGTTVSGEVKSNLSGVMIVTIEDENYNVGDTVSVSTTDGDALGEGALYINSAWNATAYTGTISTVNVTVGESIDAGCNLMDLTEMSVSSEYQSLIIQRQNYEALLQELLTLYRTETVYASCDGIVSGIDAQSTQLLANSPVEDESETNTNQSMGGTTSGGQSSMPNMGSSGSSGSMGSMGDFSGSFGSGTQMPGQSTSLYDLSTAQIASVTPQQTMELSITIDELDILKLEIGQEATITVDAIKSKEFPATITDISNTGTNNGGNSKFTVQLSLERAENMLAGMNAVATIVLDTAQDVISVPVAALVEKGTEVIIYTGYDEDKEELLNPVTVTTGVSDGDSVEILSGLSEGDTYYYAYYDTLTISDRLQMGGGSGLSGIFGSGGFGGDSGFGGGFGGGRR